MFCGNCGTKLKDGKCPKCDKKETKKTTKTEKVKAEKVKTESVKDVKEEKVNFGWFVLGFFVPIAGFIIFLVFLNSRKKLSKTAGLGALIGVIKNITIIILYYIFLFIGLFSFYNFVDELIDPSVDPYKWVEEFEDEFIDGDYDDDDEDDIETILVSDINLNETLPEFGYDVKKFDEFDNKEYKFSNDGITVIRNHDQVAIKDHDENKILFTYNNVKHAYYHAFDCSGLDTIVIVTTDKAYYINTDMHMRMNIKAVEIKGNYTDYYYTYNHSYTCGGSIIALGKDANGAYYDLNGEAVMNFDELYYYEDPNNWISINRNSKLNGGEGSVKAVVVSSVTTKIYGFIDSYGYAYTYVYDNGAADNKVFISKINDSPVKSIEYDYSNDEVKFIFENNETHTFEYAALDY